MCLLRGTGFLRSQMRSVPFGIGPVRRGPGQLGSSSSAGDVVQSHQSDTDAMRCDQTDLVLPRNVQVPFALLLVIWAFGTFVSSRVERAEHAPSSTCKLRTTRGGEGPGEAPPRLTDGYAVGLSVCSQRGKTPN